MNFRSSTSRSRRAGFDMTPMIDVVFQLIIFFMFTSQFTQMSRTRMDLPRHKGEVEEASPASLVIDVTKSGGMFIDAEAATPERVLSAVKSVSADVAREGRALQVLVRADRECPAQHINSLAATLRAAGVDRWKLATAGEGP